jgi:DNA-binding protein YbaB
MYAEYERMAEDIRSMKKRLAEIRATAESEDGLISATVGGTGRLLELWLDPRVYRAPDSVALARAITDTLHQATELVQEKGIAIARDHLPADATAETTDLRLDPFLHELDRQAAGGER